MKRNVIKVAMGVLVAVVMLAGCGGGGDGIPIILSTPTPAGTAVSMVPFKGYFCGKAAAGSELSFSLTGSDTSGNAWTGSLKVVSDGTTVFEGNNVTASRGIATVKLTSTGASATATTTTYFLTSNGNLYKGVDSSGATGVPISQSLFADTVLVGDFGNLWVINYSDGTSGSFTWKLVADNNGNSKLIISSIIKNANNSVISLEDDTYYLDSAGNPYRLSMTTTIGSTTVTLSGNKN
jgi:hypothetical protein